VSQNLAAIRINKSQQERITLGSMDMDVFDIHAEVLQRLFRPDLPEANKLSGNVNRANFDVKQQVVDLHQPVDFLMVDDISHLP